MNIKSNDIFKYIGIGVVTLMGLYIVLRTFNYQFSVMEGLANPNRQGILDDNHFSNLNSVMKDPVSNSFQKDQ